jgi:hypothetical protein
MDVLLPDGFTTIFSGSGRECIPVQFRTESENTDWNVAPCPPPQSLGGLETLK